MARLRRLSRGELAAAKALVGKDAICLRPIANRRGDRFEVGEVVLVRTLSRGGKLSLEARGRHINGVDYRDVVGKG